MKICSNCGWKNNETSVVCEKCHCSLLTHNNVNNEESLVKSDSRKTIKRQVNSHFERSKNVAVVNFEGNIYEGELIDEIPQGIGKMHFQNNVVYEGEWSYGKMEGNGKMTWPSGSYYIGNWHNNKMHGYGEIFYPDGKVYKGEFINGKITGDSTYSDKTTESEIYSSPKNKDTILDIIWQKTWRLWASIACFGIAFILAMVIFDGSSHHLKGRGIIAPIFMVYYGFKMLISFVWHLIKDK